ncbi:MAG: hypothetical protein FD129_2342 [bacterium]|nr:MAG: hypothetical protein FD129_2342 [bacterium]
MIVSLNREGSQTRVVEAQTALREGQEAMRHGEAGAARRHFADAARLDPTFPDPWFASAGTWLPFRPDMATSSIIDGVKAAMRSFRGQHRLVLNVAFLLIAIVTFSLMGTTLLITLRGLRHFQHPIFEAFRRRLPLLAAAAAGWIIVLQPILWGLGVFLTLVLLSGLLWFYVGGGERRVLVAFALLALLVPMAFNGLSRLSAPLDPESIPYLLSAASETPDQPGLAAALEAAMRHDPTAPGPHMALGLTFERAGRLDDAEREYRLALERQGDEGRLCNNLGNILARTGRLDDAVDLYQKASVAAPELVAPHFNLGQMYARRLQFDLADQEMKQASQLDFDGVRSQTAALGDRKIRWPPHPRFNSASPDPWGGCTAVRWGTSPSSPSCSREWVSRSGGPCSASFRRTAARTASRWSAASVSAGFGVGPTANRAATRSSPCRPRSSPGCCSRND